MDNKNELTHYGVKGMEWGKHKKSRYEDDSPFSDYHRKSNKMVRDSQGRLVAVKSNTPGRIKSYKYGYSGNYAKYGSSDKPIKEGKGLYVHKDKKVSGGPVGLGKNDARADVISGKKKYSYSNGPKGAQTKSNNPAIIVNEASKPNRPKNSSDLKTSGQRYTSFNESETRAHAHFRPNGDIEFTTNRGRGGPSDLYKKKVSSKNKAKIVKESLTKKLNLKHSPTKSKVNKGKAAVNSKLSKVFSKKQSTISKAKTNVANANKSNTKYKNKQVVNKMLYGSYSNRVKTAVKSAANKATAGTIKRNAIGSVLLNKAKKNVNSAHLKAPIIYNVKTKKFKNVKRG